MRAYGDWRRTVALWLEAQVVQLGIRCQFRGAQPASVTAGNGDSEDLPTVFGEAQAMGVPLVSTTHGGISQTALLENVYSGTIGEDATVAAD